MLLIFFIAGLVFGSFLNPIFSNKRVSNNTVDIQKDLLFHTKYNIGTDKNKTIMLSNFIKKYQFFFQSHLSYNFKSRLFDNGRNMTYKDISINQRKKMNFNLLKFNDINLFEKLKELKVSKFIQSFKENSNKFSNHIDLLFVKFNQVINKIIGFTTHLKGMKVLNSFALLLVALYPPIQFYLYHIIKLRRIIRILL